MSRLRRWLILFVVFTLPVAILAGIYGAASYSFYSQKIVIAHDYTAEVNAPILALPEELCASFHYKRANQMLSAEPFALPYTPGEIDWETTVAYLRQNRAALAAIRSAAQVERLGALVTGPRLFATLSGDPFGILWLAQRLGADCHLAVIEKDATRAAANLTALLQIAEHARQMPHLAEQLKALTIEQMALMTCRKIVSEHPDLFTETELSSLATQLSLLAAKGPARLDLRWERLTFLDETQRCFTDDGQGDGWMTLPNWLDNFAGEMQVEPPLQFLVLPAPIGTRFVATRSEGVAKFDDCLARFTRHIETPLWQRGDMPDPISIEIAQAEERYWFVYFFLESLPHVTDLAERQTQERDATIVAIALARYYFDHKKWPESLERLVPQYLTSVPPDRYDGRPLRYRLVNGAPRLYSIGENRIDELGRLGPELPAADVSAAYGQVPRDWLFWPIDDNKPAIRSLADELSRDDASEGALPVPPEPSTDGDPDDPGAEVTIPNDNSRDDTSETTNE